MCDNHTNSRIPSFIQSSSSNPWLTVEKTHWSFQVILHSVTAGLCAKGCRLAVCGSDRFAVLSGKSTNTACSQTQRQRMLRVKPSVSSALTSFPAVFDCGTGKAGAWSQFYGFMKANYRRYEWSPNTLLYRHPINLKSFTSVTTAKTHIEVAWKMNWMKWNKRICYLVEF